ncbi:MAG: DUF883 family protein [Alphaproteobacteria bacterium]|nr:DUF883 family protein [Alphaproteobacteria bacterium]
MDEHKYQSASRAATPPEQSANADINAQIEQLKREVHAVANTVSEAASGQLHHAQEQAEAALGEFEQRVRREPITSVAIAAGVGLLVGILISR